LGAHEITTLTDDDPQGQTMIHRDMARVRKMYREWFESGRLTTQIVPIKYQTGMLGFGMNLTYVRALLWSDAIGGRESALRKLKTVVRIAIIRSLDNR